MDILYTSRLYLISGINEDEDRIRAEIRVSVRRKIKDSLGPSRCYACPVLFE